MGGTDDFLSSSRSSMSSATAICKSEGGGAGSGTNPLESDSLIESLASLRDAQPESDLRSGRPGGEAGGSEKRRGGGGHLSLDLFEFVAEEIFLFLSPLRLLIGVDGLDDDHGGLGGGG
jgi:hypothetical protein